MHAAEGAQGRLVVFRGYRCVMPLRLDTPMPSLRPVHRWLNGGPVREPELRGRPVLVHFWALSCPTCKEQFPRLAEWQARFPELQMVSIHTPLSVEDMNDDGVMDAVAAFDLEMPVALDGDDGALADAFHIQVLPAFFVFDAEGRLRLYHAGPAALEPVGRALERLMHDDEQEHHEEHPHQPDGQGAGATH